MEVLLPRGSNDLALLQISLRSVITGFMIEMSRKEERRSALPEINTVSPMSESLRVSLPNSPFQAGKPTHELELLA